MSMNLKNLLTFSLLSLLAALFFSCNSLNQLASLPDGTYLISKENYVKLTGVPAEGLPPKIKAKFQWEDSVWQIKPLDESLARLGVPLRTVNDIRLNRRSSDLNFFTIPFKFRPSVAGFPQQLNTDFSAALYWGRRFDHYSVKNLKKSSTVKPQIVGYSFGFGGLFGISKVGVSPNLTKNNINYAYDGFALNGGLAAIYDTRRFTFGLAVGTDYLLDKNRKHWIYQGKPWIGLLFGINLN